MTEDWAIRYRGVSKAFRLNLGGSNSIKTLLVWWRKRRVETLPVLTDLDLEVRRGECLAIVGRNGAGKSTLLSLLARIYRPDRGTIEVRGRVAPLLELGAGFHPDLSGWENILFNAVILGLSRKEALARMPEIAAFSELGDHLGAPVRTYSSGMQARLGFSVAMHVDAEVLVVDEVLAVGDRAFERKCYAKIAEFRASGGTILLVSHQAETVRSFADRAAWLEGGGIKILGSPEEIIRAYQAEV